MLWTATLLGYLHLASLTCCVGSHIESVLSDVSIISLCVVASSRILDNLSDRGCIVRLTYAFVVGARLSPVPDMVLT